MRLTEIEKSCLEELYLHFAIPTDQLRRNRVVLGRITAALNRLTDRTDEASELLRYMINRRKNRDWPKLGDKARKFSPAMHELEEGDIDLLDTIYVTINIPLDEYLIRPDLPRRLAKEFTAKTKRILPHATLVAALMAYRKRGNLTCLVEEKTAGAKRPFADIEIVARTARRAAQQ